MNYRVTIQIDGEDLTCGTLFQSVRHGVETTTFSYDSSYLRASNGAIRQSVHS